MANSVIRLEWVKIGNIGNDEIVASLGGGQYINAASTPVMSAAANTSSVSIGYPIANNTGCYARVTACSNNATVVATSNTSLTFTEDLGYRVPQGQTVFLKAQEGWVVFVMQSTN